MTKLSLILLTSLGALFAFLGNASPLPSDAEGPLFGGPKDVAFAKAVWKAAKGYESWKLNSKIFKGMSPHGKQFRLFSTFVTVGGKDYPVILKDNYGGRGVTPERVTKDPKAWLKAVTIMLKREAGYDKENKDWFYAKYSKDGVIAKNSKGVSLVGRVGKGMNRGCISCHAQAGGGDFLFSND